MSRFFIFLTIVALLPIAASAGDKSALSFRHSVTTEAARVEPHTKDKSYVSIRCWQASATPVYLGGKDVSPNNGYAICSSTPDRSPNAAFCQSDVISLDVSNLYAVASAPHGAPRSPSLHSLSCIIVQ
jgi:hypothetical protein